MFGKLLGKTKDESIVDDKHRDIIEKISKMNLSDMRFYVNNKLKDYEITEYGISEIIRRLISKHETTSARFIEIDAMPAKIKKAFDLVIVISKSKKLTVVSTELIQEFITMYDDIIKKFDEDNKQIYASKLDTALSQSVIKIIETAELKRKMKILGK